MSREWSAFEDDWPILMQAHQSLNTGQPVAPLPPTTGSAPAAGRCMPADPFSMLLHDENMCYPMYHPYQYPSSHDSMTLSSPETSFHQLYSPPHQQYQMQMPRETMPMGDVVAAAAAFAPKGDNPREIRNKAEKQRRDKLNQSIAELANMVPPVVAASRKIDKTGILRLTAHYLRAHQYVFGDSVGHSEPDISTDSAFTFLQLLNGFLITTTYKGIVVVVSQNVQKFIGYTELDLLGQNIMTIVHEDDRKMLKEQLMPKSDLLGPHGELLLPDEPDGKRKVVQALDNEKRTFIIRLKKLSQRSEAQKYVTCQVDGSLRKADRACRGYNRCCQMVRRARARGDNPCSSGNDVVFVGMVRPTTESFISEREIEGFRMEYRTRHSVDGQILQSEQRISLVTGYMLSEVNGLNAMNFMHRDDVRWVVIALREMYDQRRLSGSSCYRLMTKNGQFIYMKTQGQLEVDESSNAVSTFVCTNTVVDEIEGKHLIKLMKKKFTTMINNNDDLPPDQEDSDTYSNNDKQTVEDPKQLEQVIMHMVTNISSPTTDTGSRSSTPEEQSTSCHKLAIIPPRKDHIVNAIEKIYGVIKINDIPNSSKMPSINISYRGIQDTTVLPSFNELNNLGIKIEVLSNDKAFQFRAKEVDKQTTNAKPKPKATSFEECFLNFDDNGEGSTASFIPKVSDQVLGAVQLGKKDGCDMMDGQVVGHKRPIHGDDLSHTFKRKTFETQMEKDTKLTDTVLFSNNDLEALLEQGISTQLDNDALGLLQSMGDTNETSVSFPDLLGAEFNDLFETLAAENLQDEIPGPETAE